MLLRVVLLKGGHMSGTKFLPVGAGGFLSPEHVIAVGRWTSAPIRRAARQARAENRLIDLTYGKACCWVYFMDSDHLILGTRDTSYLVSRSVGEDDNERTV